MYRTLLNWKQRLTNVAVSSPRLRRRCNFRLRRLRMETLEQRQLLAITVDNFLDEFDLDRSPGDTSFCEAIIDANIAGDTIMFSTDPIHALNGATIQLDQNLGEIAFSKSLTIDASMLSSGITIQAYDPTPTQKNGDGFRIFTATATKSRHAQEPHRHRRRRQRHGSAILLDGITDSQGLHYNR